MDIVVSTVARMRLIVIGMASGLIVVTAVSGVVELGPSEFAVRASLPVGLAGLMALVAGWRVYAARGPGETEVDLTAICSRYTSALLVALAITEGVAFLGIVVYTLGGEVVALTGVASHILLSGVLWPTAEKVRPSH